jgi:hypothetical protein
MVSTIRLMNKISMFMFVNDIIDAEDQTIAETRREEQPSEV